MTTSTLIANFRAAAEEIEARLAPSACAMIASHNWIVIDDFGPMTFMLTPEGGKHRATCTGHGRAHKVNRFTKADAEHLAQACNARAATLPRSKPSAPPDRIPAGPSAPPPSMKRIPP